VAAGVSGRDVEGGGNDRGCAAGALSLDGVKPSQMK